MAATVHLLHSAPAPIEGFLRVGHTGHRKLEALLASNRLKFQRFVFDAGHIDEQVELSKALKTSGCEIVLDPNFAEMATAGRYGSSISKLPWGNADRPWEPSDFSRVRNVDTAKAVAEFAVKHGVNAVLAPTNLIESIPSAWTIIDLRLCEQLRHELDRLGGTNIAIDYQLITSNTLLKDGPSRDVLITSLRDLPIENIWIRASGFGAGSTGAATRSFIESMRLLHELGRPLIADYAGGLSGLASAAFGAVGAMSYGVGQKESFRVGEWKRPSSGGGGSGKRIYIPELDRSFKQEQLTALFEVKGARSRFACNDASCCKHGVEDMVEHPHVHFITQRSRQIDNLSKVPESRRAEHFLLHHLDPPIRSARNGARLKIADEVLSNALAEAKKRLVHLRDPLGDLHAQEENATRPRAPRFRGGKGETKAATGS